MVIVILGSDFLSHEGKEVGFFYGRQECIRVLVRIVMERADTENLDWESHSKNGTRPGN